MPPTPRPTGFAILAGLLAVHTAISFVSFLWEGPDWTHPVSLVSRLAGGAGLVLAGVGAVALWRVEPWAHRAVGGWAMACAAQGFVNGAANTGTLGGGFLFSIASTVVPFLAFLYAEKRTHQIHGRARARAAAPPAHLAPPVRVPPPPPARARTP